MRILLFVILSFLMNFISLSQTLKSSQQKSLLYILVVDKNDIPIEEEILIISLKTKKEYKVKSNTNGLAEVLLPIFDRYSINLEFEQNYDIIDIPNKEFYTLNYKIFYDKKRQSNSNIALIRFTVKDTLNNPISEEIVLENIMNKEVYQFKTDKNGYGECFVQNNSSYSVNYKSAPNYDRIKVPNTKDYILDFRSNYNGSFEGAIYPSQSKVLFNFTYVDLDSIPLSDEKFYLQDDKTGEIYSTVTNKNGKSHLLVPIGRSYNISSEFFKNFEYEKISSKPDLYIVNVVLKFVSSVEFKKRKELQELRLKEREVEWEKRKKEYDAIVKKRLTDSSYTSTIINYTPMYDSVFTVVLNRNNHWKNKLIILDVTGSMQPYTDQVKTWYTINYAKNDPIQFVLFNDGDNLQDNLKQIGKTGGIHYCKYCNIKDFNDTLNYSRYLGNGGDGPENDLEATIAALSNCKDYTDVILVVDNYSPVKDIELLTKINKPIKIVICGGYNGIVNEDYLEIAYHTKGSIHTIEEDILTIGKTLDGAKVKIGKHYYVLTKGKFVHYKDETN